MDGRQRCHSTAKAVGSMHERAAGGSRTGFIKRRIPDIDRGMQAVPLYNKANVFSFGTPGTALTFKILKQPAQGRPCQKALDIAVLAVAYDKKRSLFRQGSQHFGYAWIKHAAMLRKVAAFVPHAGAAHFLRGRAVAGEQTPGYL